MKHASQVSSLNTRLHGSTVYSDSVSWGRGRLKGGEGGKDEFQFDYDECKVSA